jgi:hypothetical protein
MLEVSKHTCCSRHGIAVFWTSRSLRWLAITSVSNKPQLEYVSDTGGATRVALRLSAGGRGETNASIACEALLA